MDRVVFRSKLDGWLLVVMMAAAAGSTAAIVALDRLRIEYVDHRVIMISPDDRARFLDELRRRMPGPLPVTIRP